jgi:hypothetical protein
MDRLYWTATRFFGCVAIALLVLGAFVVPDQFAYADSGISCSSACAQFISQPAYYTDCMNQCSSCDSTCSTEYGAGTSGYWNCMQTCFGGVIKTSCPSPIANTCYLNNGNPAGCRNTMCATAAYACDCVVGSGNSCSCPP